jgi:hypothetical protein
MRRPLLYCSKPSPPSTFQTAAGVMPLGSAGSASATGSSAGAAFAAADGAVARESA